MEAEPTHADAAAFALYDKPESVYVSDLDGDDQVQRREQYVAGFLEEAAAAVIARSIANDFDVDALTDIMYEMQRLERYPPEFAGDENLKLFDSPAAGMIFKDAAYMLVAQSKSKVAQASGLCALGCIASQADRLRTKMLCFAALELDPTCAFAFLLLGATAMKPKKILRLADGRMLSLADVYLTAIRFCPPNHRESLAFFFLLLSSAIHRNCGASGGTTITLPDGRVVDAVTLPDGRVMHSSELVIEALRTHPIILMQLYDDFPGRETATLPDGRVLTKQQLLIEILTIGLCPDTHFHPKHLAQYLRDLAQSLSGTNTATISGRPWTKMQLLVEYCLCDNRTFPSAQAVLYEVPIEQLHWTPRYAPLFGNQVNCLFATLLLGLQRLETAGVLPQAHHSMLEDMLEAWIPTSSSLWVKY